MSSAVRSHYKRLIKSRELTPDAAQAQAIEGLIKLECKIYHAHSFWRQFLGINPRVYGLYLWGLPGRGKSMMMDMFYEQIRFPSKRRIHFHAFMAEVHGLVKQWREGDAKTRKQIFGTHKGDDPIAPIAGVIAKQSKLLCFDELQVTDIADAMIIGRLVEALFARKVMIVITSNRAPDELYKNGLNRDLFLPFIRMISQKMKVLEIKGPKDFRLDRLKGSKVYFSPSDSDIETKAYNDLWAKLTKNLTETGARLDVNDRKLEFKRAAGPLLRASFAELCAANNGAQDYLAISERFTTIFIDHVPKLTVEKRNEAKRFVTLIDALYEAGVKLVVLAEAEPADLYPKGDGAFEFERTVSRLEEMRSEAYLDRVNL